MSVTGVKLLVICGATATGKTKLALHLAKQFGGELISADSRQVYKGLDIGTGKDLPLNAEQQTNGSYLIDDVVVWGYDLIWPDQEFSVGHFNRFAESKIKDIWAGGHLPILVGGTGLYIKAIVDTVATADVPRDEVLRGKLKDDSPDDLFELLNELDFKKAAGMNESDRKNPRRLIRAIEIARSGEVKTNESEAKKSVLQIGLIAGREELEKRIGERVDSRTVDGMEKEVKEILKEVGSFEGVQAFTATGYKLWERYFNNEMTKEELREFWITQELQYAKRQMNWFKKDKRIIWFDVTQIGWQKEVESKLNKWYSVSG